MIWPAENSHSFTHLAKNIILATLLGTRCNVNNTVNIHKELITDQRKQSETKTGGWLLEYNLIKIKHRRVLQKLHKSRMKRQVLFWCKNKKIMDSFFIAHIFHEYSEAPQVRGYVQG